MKKFLSFILAFVMMVTTFVGVFPPLEVSAASSPYVKTFSSDVEEVTVGDTVTFTIKTSSNVNGVCLAVRDVNDDESLTIISTNKSSTKKKSFTIEYSFQKTNATDSNKNDISNTRTVYAFIVDKNGAIVDESDYKEIDITVNPAKYTFSNFTTYDCHVDIGSRAKIEWDAVSSKDGSTVTYKVYIDDEFYDDTTRTYMYVDAEDIEDMGEGDYWIGVFATAPSHRQKQSSARLYIEEAVDDQKPTIDPIDVSPSLTVTEGETITFSTEATDDTKLSELTMYIDGDEVKNVSASGASKSISYSTSSLSVGSHTTKVTATDAAGNTNEVTANITVKSKAVTVDFSKVNVVDEITVGERITWSGTVSVSGSKINTISVGIMKSTDNGIYYRKTGVGSASYNIANIQNGYIPTGSTAPAGVRPGANAGEWVNYNDFIINTPGTYWIRVSVYTESGETIKSESFNIVVKAAPDTTKPIIDPITVSPSSLTITEGDTISFSTNASDETKLSKLELYIGNELKKSVSATGKEKSISFSTSDLAVGTYTVKVKATDAAGNTNEVTANITVKSKAVTVDFSKVNVVDEITVGERITWSGTVSVSGSKINTISVGIMKSTDNGIYYRKTGVGSASYNIANIQNGYIPTGSTAPAGVRPGANAGEWVNYNDFIINTPGTYWIRVSVYTESGETIKSDAYYITVKAAADKTKPLIDPIKLSATKVTEYSELEISTAASDNVGLKSIQLFINDEKVKEWSAKGTYTTISHKASGYSVGSHTVKVIAIDQSGNQNSVETTFTVEKKQGGEIYSVEMSSYNFKAGTTITFTVTTSTDTEKIRLRNGTWIFPNDITDSTTKNGKKVWVFEQYVETVGTNRVLTVETYLSGWTGNMKNVTFTVTPAEVNMPAFDIDLAIIGLNGGNLSWTHPEGIVPDRYVINIGGANTYSTEVTGNSVTFDSSVFTLAGTYTISVTAQKTGYNPYTASITMTLKCDHTDLKPIFSRDTNELYFDETYHTVNTETTYECQDCGGQITKTEVSLKTEHTHNVQLERNGWVCSCGYVYTGDYKSWTGYLQSDVNQPVYSTPKNFINANVIGTIFTDDIITVLGECGDTYFVRYNVTVGTKNQRTYSNGNTKSGYIPKSKVDSVEYNKGSVYDIYVDGQSVLSKLHDNNILYSDLDALLKSVKGVTSIKQNGNYEYVVSITHSVNSKNVTFFVSFVDDAKTYSWSNVSVKLENGNTVDKEIIIGSFIYLDRIFIETNKFMEFLGYTIDDVYYNSANYKVDTKLYNAAENILFVGDSIDNQYDEMPPLWATKAESVILHIFNLDPGDIISDLNYQPDQEIINTIEFMLMEGTYSTKQRSFEMAIFENLSEFLGTSLDSFDLAKDALEKSASISLSDNVKNACSSAGITLATIDLIYSAGKLDATEALVIKSIMDNYFDNIDCLDILITEAEKNGNSKLVSIYKEVKEDIIHYYENQIVYFLDRVRKDEAYRNELVDAILKFGVATGCIVLGVAGGTVGAVLGTVATGFKLVSLILDSESHYESNTGIHRTVSAIDLLAPELELALQNYFNYPTDDTKYILVSYAYMLGDIKVKCMTYCIQYIDSNANRNNGVAIVGGIAGMIISCIGDLAELLNEDGADERRDQLETEKDFLIEQIEIVEVYK